MTRRRKTIFIGGLLVLVAIAAAALLLTDDSDQDPPAINPALIEQQNYHQTQYAAGVSTSWPQDSNDKRVGGYLESAWHDPASEEVVYVIDSISSEESGTPIATAQVSRIHARQMPDYKEHGMKRVKIRDTPAVRWKYYAGGRSWVEYYFEECGVNMVVRGSSPLPSLENFAEFYRGMTFTITANCD
jgi:hypothetical protein